MFKGWEVSCGRASGLLGCFYFLFPVHVWCMGISPLNWGGVFRVTYSQGLYLPLVCLGILILLAEHLSAGSQFHLTLHWIGKFFLWSTP